MGCSIKGNGKNGPLIINGKNSGLIMNHAYSLNDVIEFEDEFNKGNVIRLLRLRNPWGKSEWLGSWNDKSPEVEKYRHKLEEYIASLAPDE
jgi:hypothetical protein